MFRVRACNEAPVRHVRRHEVGLDGEGVRRDRRVGIFDGRALVLGCILTRARMRTSPYDPPWREGSCGRRKVKAHRESGFTPLPADRTSAA
jgi:hypothetical protein